MLMYANSINAWQTLSGLFWGGAVMVEREVLHEQREDGVVWCGGQDYGEEAPKDCIYMRRTL